MTDDVPSVRLTPSVDKVLGVLAAASGRKLSVRQVAAGAAVSAGTAAKALSALKAARLAQCVDQRHRADVPPHTVWWLTGDGRALARARGQRAAG